MKQIFTSIFFLTTFVLSIRSQTLYGVSFNGGNDGGGAITKLVADAGNLTVAKSLESFAATPYRTNLVQASDGKFYGMTFAGGRNNAGVIFSYDPVNSDYKKLKDFDIADGGWPIGSLMQATNGKLYGMTIGGGNNDNGVLFSFDAAASAYSVLKKFDNTNGVKPSGGLLQASDGKLYGMTIYGGSYGDGVLFVFDPNSSTYTKLKDFDFFNGENPSGKLIQASDGKLYGTTLQGGDNNVGVIFSYDPVSSTYLKRMDFNFSTGGSPAGSLVLANDGKLYGVTNSWGSGNDGVIFSFDPVASAYADLIDFDDVKGRNPLGGLIEANDGKLYGMTSAGGSNNDGVIFSFDPSTVSYTKLNDFDDSKGITPSGSLLQANDGKLYGMTSGSGQGESIDDGVLFSFDPIADIYKKLKEFGVTESGSNVSGGLVRASNEKLYGMATNGGNNALGIIFSFDPFTSAYTKLTDLNYNDGVHPYGRLIQGKDGKLYGMTPYGGFEGDFHENNVGVIFSFDAASSAYRKIFQFDSYYHHTGSNPFGSLIQAKDGKFYGMTSTGGGGYRGTGGGSIFSFDPSAAMFTKIKDFSIFDTEGLDTDDHNGISPYGNLIQASDGNLYGMTSQGGDNGLGVLFSYKPGNSEYNKLAQFDGTNGANPYGSLIQGKDGKLYGMTWGGGVNNAGVLFSYDASSSTYAKLYDFDFANGSHPYGDLMQASNGKLYGMTSSGGSNDYGVVFSFDLVSSTFNKLIDYDGSNGANPYFGSGFIELAELAPLPVTLLNFTGDNKGNVNKLFWEIADEQDLNYFEVQRSLNGQQFNDISQIKSTGKSSYTYSDVLSAITSTSYYYRLKIANVDGNFKYSDVIKITVNLKDVFINVNPNPFKDVLVVTIQSPEKDNATFVLTDFNGRRVFTRNELLQKGPNVVQINGNGRLTGGTYLLTITTSNRRESVKVVKY